MLKEFGSGALGLLRGTSKISSRNAIAASFRAIDTPSDGKRWVFQDVAPGGLADRAGSKPSDTLLRIRADEAIPPSKRPSQWAQTLRSSFGLAMGLRRRQSRSPRPRRSIATTLLLSRAPLSHPFKRASES